MTDLQDQTPVEIDTALAALYGEQARLGQRLAMKENAVHRAADDEQTYQRGRGTSTWGMTLEEALDVARKAVTEHENSYVRSRAAEALAQYAEAREALGANHAAQRVLGAEFQRRGGWTRAFLVTNGNGHVHSSMNCSTCNRGQYDTQFQWMVAYSDHAEAEIVEAAGWRACSICYPSAPVSAFASEKDAKGALPTKMFSKQDEEKAAARIEREQAKAARDAKKRANAPTLSGEPLEVQVGWRTWRGEQRPDTETFQTERSAMIWATDQLAWGPYSNYRPEPLSAFKQAAVKIVAEKIAEKRGVETSVVEAEMNKKAEKKAKG